MNNNSKKEILLIIFNSLFYDNSSEINKKNCISFYNHLLNVLEVEVVSIPKNQKIDISLCDSIIYLLSNFDLIKNISEWNSTTISFYLKNLSKLTDVEFQISIHKFREMYRLIKRDFLIDHP